MNRRLVVVGLLVVSTAVFVVGVSVERSPRNSHDEPAGAAESSEAAESPEEHAGEEASETEEGPRSEEGGAEADKDEEERVLGVDLEATPVVALAAAFSLGLALAAWLRPEWRLLLALVAVAMVVLAALDVREVVHQLDEDNGGLAAFAGVVAALHLAGAAVALSMGRSAALAPSKPAA